MMEAISLYELNHYIRQSLRAALPDAYWVQAELSEVREAYNGHCYIELVQKAEQGNTFIAKARGTIWANIYKMLKPYFENATGQSFTAGIKVLLQVSVDFHEQYGLSLTVHDIDPTYTLGDMARRRREILMQLEAEGVLTLNKELPMPQVSQRVAVISAAGAAGYGDFCDQLMSNPYGFAFYPHLFPAVMQGDKVESSIIAALDSIAAERDHWDVVVIIRGGGATSDLSGFDTYLLAANCAQFPLPIITGIGHERDDTVLDIVAHTRVKTPTAAAEHLINALAEAAACHDTLVNRLTMSLTQRLHHEEQRLQQLATRLPSSFALMHAKQQHRLAQIENTLHIALQHTITKQQHHLVLLEKTIESASPSHILKRGYTITRCNGKVVTSASKIPQGAILTTEWADGTVTSEAKGTRSDHPNETNNP